MGLVKFEVDIPDFEKEISINIIIRKDGEVLYNSSTSPSSTDVNQETKKKIEKKTTTTSTKKAAQTTTTPSPAMGGNLMNLTDF